MNIGKQLTERYGRNIKERFAKLAEEVTELLEAKDETAIMEELADVQLVLYHILCIKKVTTEDMVLRALDKIQKRDANINYMRKHKHKDRCCGNCKYFLNEDTLGWGLCQHESEKPKECFQLCLEWEEKQK